MSEQATFYGTLARALRAELARSRDTLVPPAFQDLWQPVTWHVWHGGRASAKS